MVSAWLLGLFLLGTWCLWGVAAAAWRAAADAPRGVPEKERGGVSLVPAIPRFPVAFLGLARLIDRAWPPWGTWVVGGAHGVFALALAISIARDRRYARAIGREEAPGRDGSNVP